MKSADGQKDKCRNQRRRRRATGIWLWLYCIMHAAAACNIGMQGQPAAAFVVPTINRRSSKMITPTTLLRPDWNLHARLHEDDDDDDDDEPPEIGSTADFLSSMNKPALSYGLHKGRSPPSQRKAMGTAKEGSTTVYCCTNCGSESVKWMGRCPTCQEWNTFQEFSVHRSASSTSLASRDPLRSISSPPRPVFGGSGDEDNDISPLDRPTSWLDTPSSIGPGVVPTRLSKVIQDSNNLKKSGKSNRLEIPDDDELNTVLGGGMMKGSLVLLGGDPGVGKSTLLLQLAGSLAEQATPLPGIGMGALPSADESLGPVWYVSGEETAEQIASRASRLGISSSELFLLCETQVNVLCDQVVQAFHPYSYQVQASPGDEESSPGRSLPPSLLIVDSIQTLVCDAGGSSAPGGVTQVKECVGLLLRLAKSLSLPIVLVGHVTKSGDVAGPRTVEHMVDAVLYLEGAGDYSSNLRTLRATKNRFGSSTEVGYYEMTSGRLLPVSDPSSFLMANRMDHQQEDVEGCAVALVNPEGSMSSGRILTVEIQALATVFSAADKAPRRTVAGIPYARLQLLIGVLQKYTRQYFGRHDVYINVAGGTGAGSTSDLAVAMALTSSLQGIPVRSDTAFCGEIGLLGELRRMPNLEQRVQEARRMGFSRVITPPNPNAKGQKRVKSRPGATTKSTNYHGIEWITCEKVKDAINEGLVRPLAERKPRSRPTRESSSDAVSLGRESRSGRQYPGNIDDLGLDTPIVDADTEEEELDDGFQ